MRQELYHYAISLKNKNLSNFPIVCVWIILTIFLIPLLLSNIWLGLIILLSYLMLFFCMKKETIYQKYLIDFGLFMLFLGVEISAMIIIQYKIAVSLCITTFFLIVFYELLWLFKIKKKLYSQYNRNAKQLSGILSLVFGSTGVWFGKLIASNENTNFKIWIAILLCSVIIAGSVSVLQKYFVIRIIKK